MNQVRRVRHNYQEPKFPRWEAPQGGVGFIVGALLWIVMLLGFLFLFYVQLFSLNARYLLAFVQPNIKPVPFWFAVLIVVFLFPLSLSVVLLGALIKLLRN